MDAVIEDADALPTQVHDAQAALALAIARANLSGDPLGSALEGIAKSLGAQLALHQAGSAHLRDVSDRLDLQVTESLARAEKELALAETSVIDKLVPHIATRVDRSIDSRIRLTRLRTLAMSAGLGALLAVAAIAGGYTVGRDTGAAEAVSATHLIEAAVARGGPAAATALTRLIANNDLAQAMAACRKAVVAPDGRQACLMPVWLDPPPAPARQ